ncbi:MAG: acetylxylan esterase, partial [Cyclobacteriaceae bacterium]
TFLQTAMAQSQQGQYIRIMVSPSNEDMIYETGDEVTFNVAIFKFGQLVEDATINYELGPEMMEPTKKETITLKNGEGKLKAGSLDTRIKYLVSYYPALSDLTGYLHGRAGGWPHLFKDQWSNHPDKIETSKYYDVANFARFVKIPGFYSLGFNDNVCPPTSIYAAINSIPGKKEISLYKDASHWQYPEQGAEGIQWMLNNLNVK